MDHHVMKTLIVDDEPIARRVLREELEAFPEIKIIGEAENGKQALRQIAALNPDLVFLDLQMPVMSGFEVVRKLGGGRLPVIVIVTAFDEHAIEAFEAGAIDYLLKPVREARLRKAVERARSLRKHPIENANIVATIASAALPNNSTSGRKIVGRDGTEYFLLNPNEILAFQADRELVWIVTAKQRFLATQNLRVIGRGAQGTSVPAGPPQCYRQRESHPEDERDEQSALAHHIEQLPANRSEQAPGSQHPEDFALVALPPRAAHPTY
jgi:two-component system, LytTR family, response regulator